MAAKPCILVVDDEASVLFTYRMILEQQGYAATAAVSCKKALEEVAQHDFDLLLCDLSLEERTTGFEVFDAARQRNADVPCVLLTGYASHDAVEKAEKQGVTVLFKPIEIDEFLSTVSNLLRNYYDQAKVSGQ